MFYVYNGVKGLININSKPNIVVIMCDQMRGDCLGIAGHPDVKTPSLDTLASRGIRFENTYSACPSCIPARAAFHTGLSQKHHGRVGYKDGVSWNYPCTLAGELSKNGYYTECIGKMHVHPQRNLVGFHHIELHNGVLEYYRKPNVDYSEHQSVADDYLYEMGKRGLPNAILDSGIECNSWVARPWMYDEADHPTNWVTTRSIDFLRRRDRSKPFFLMASYVRPHPPFDAPACYFDMYRDMELREPPVGDWADEEGWKRCGRFYNSETGPLDKEFIRQAQIGYYACITHLDHQIGRLVQALEEDDLYNNTLIIFTSDHGELLCDHHTFRKSRPYQGSVNVPMIVCGPPHLVPKRGVASDTLIELCDVMPTLLQAAGAEVPESLDGISFFGDFQGKTDGKHRDYIHGEHSGGGISTQYIITKTDKYIWYSQTGVEQYFDLENDPTELHNAISDAKYQDRIAKLRSLLIDELKDREEGYVQNGELIVGQTPVACLKHILEE